jgi:signal transduction histidine kinase
VSVRFLLENSKSWLYVKSDDTGRLTYRNDLFRTSFNNIRPVKFTDLLADSEDIDDFSIAFDQATNNPNNAAVFYCKMLQRTGVPRWGMWEVMKILDEYHLTGQLLYDVVSKQSYEYERIRKQLDDLKMTISHEMRQPLTSIVSLVGLIQTVDKQSEPDEFDRLCRMLTDSTTALDGVFRRALDRGEIGGNTR